MNKIESRTLSRKLELRADGDKPARIAGMAAVFYRADDPGTQFELWEGAWERIMPGAFTSALQEDDVVAVFNHDDNLVLGRTHSGTLTLTQTPDGLAYEITPSDSRMYQDLAIAIERGDVYQSSFRFIPRDVTWKMDGKTEIREINSVKLIDVSPVTNAAYSATSVQVRSSIDWVKRNAELNRMKRDKTLRELVFGPMLVGR